MFPSLQAMANSSTTQKYRGDLEERNQDFLNNVEALRAKLMGQGALGDNPYGNPVAEEVFRPHAPASPGKDFFASKEPGMDSMTGGPQGSMEETMIMGVTLPKPGIATLNNPGDPQPNEDTQWRGQSLYSEGPASLDSPETPADIATGTNLGFRGPTGADASVSSQGAGGRLSLPGMSSQGKPGLPDFNRILQMVLGGGGNIGGSMGGLMGKIMGGIPGGISPDQGGFTGQGGVGFEDDGQISSRSPQLTPMPQQPGLGKPQMAEGIPDPFDQSVPPATMDSTQMPPSAQPNFQTPTPQSQFSLGLGPDGMAIRDALASPVQTARRAGEGLASGLGSMAQGAYEGVDNGLQSLIKLLQGGPKLPPKFNSIQTPDPYANQGQFNTMNGRMSSSPKFGL